MGMEKTGANRVPRVVLNERRRLAVKSRLNGATIAGTRSRCELGRSAVIRAMQACERGGWKVFSGALHAKILIGFMKRLVHGRQKKVFLILDNLRVRHSKTVKQWLKENAEKSAVFSLPSYSPELNPDELLDADSKQHATKAAPARNKIALT